MDFLAGNMGWIEVVCGPMFSGKSEELIRRLRRAIIARRRVQVFKPVLDDRYSKDEIVSHSEQRIASTVVNGASAAGVPAAPLHVAPAHRDRAPEAGYRH